MRTRARSALAATILLAVAVIESGGTTSWATAPASESPPNSGAVRLWNQYAVEALMNPASPPAGVPAGAGQTAAVGVLHMAMVQGAVYDAVNAIDGGHQPYLSGLPAASANASLDAAVATAAHHVLVGLGIAPVPALPDGVRSRLDGLYATSLGAIPDGPAETAGIEIGAAAAAAMLGARTGDGRYVPFIFPTGTETGEWRPTSNVNDPFAWVAKVDPFVIDDASQFRTHGPLPMETGAYARDYDEVKTLGAANGPRSPEQEALAVFFAGNPIPMYNGTFRGISAEQGLSLVEDARLFAMLDIAAADALIACWDDKVEWGFWRPITAIHNGDVDGNDATVGDTTWASQMAVTPPYPDHPSGYNCGTAAFMHTAKAFFGRDRLDFTLVRAPGVSRAYRRLTDVIDDTIDARVYQGIHFRTADEQGATLGREVARFVEHHAFQTGG